MSSIKGPIKRVGEEPRRAASRPNQAPAYVFVGLVRVNRVRRKNTARLGLKRTDWKTLGLIIPTGKCLIENSLRGSSCQLVQVFVWKVVSKRDYCHALRIQLFVDHVKDIYSCWRIIFVQAV